MQEGQRRQKLFYNRAHHRLREIEFSCRQVINLSTVFNNLASEINNSEVNSRKLQIIKAQIKDKLRQFASNIDEIYKILDRKIVIIIRELDESKNGSKRIQNDSPILDRAFLKNVKDYDKLSQSQNARNSLKSSSERLFSDTLNPRITNLEARIAEYQQNQISYKKKIIELKQQNAKLIEQFDRLSTASNKTINDLKSELSYKFNRTSQQNPQSLQNHIRPTLSLTPNSSNIKHLAASPNKNRKNQIFYEKEQNSRQQIEQFYQSPHLNFYQPEQPKSLLNFGCMPGKQFITEKPSIINLQTNDTLDRNDRNRRWDLMLNKLRTSQQQSTQGSCQQMFLAPPQQRVNSLISNMQYDQRSGSFGTNVIRKHQI